MNASAMRKTNQFHDCGQSSNDQISDYFGKVALCDNHIDQNNDYSALNHYLDRQRIDTQCALISTGWTYQRSPIAVYLSRGGGPDR
jgi:hypothetical protein